MKKRGSARRLGAVLAVMAVSMLTTFGVGAGTALAVPGCPSGSGQVSSWGQIWSRRGVTMCRGFETGSRVIAYLQIAQFSDGAKLRVESSPSNAPGAYNTEFYKKNVVGGGSDWESWIRANDRVVSPSLLFSQINAGFFVDTSSRSTTTLSMPEVRGGAIQSTGWALAHHEDAAWEREKQTFYLGEPSSTPQYIEMWEFPTHYTYANINETFVYALDGLVGFAPLAGETGTSNRTMIGLNTPWPSGPGFPPEVAYILSATGMTLREARGIVVNAGGGYQQIQLDGGCSMQMHATALVADFPAGPCRAVPEVLALYMAP